MKKVRFILVLAVALTLGLGITATSNIAEAASQTVNFPAVTVHYNHTYRWFPTGGTGYTLTNGQNQTLSYRLSTTGNKIGMGFMKYSSKTNYSYYSGILNSTTKTVTKVLSGSTASYQPYLQNNNVTGDINLVSGYATMQ